MEEGKAQLYSQPLQLTSGIKSQDSCGVNTKYFGCTQPELLRGSLQAQTQPCLHLPWRTSAQTEHASCSTTLQCLASC